MTLERLEASLISFIRCLQFCRAFFEDTMSRTGESVVSNLLAMLAKLENEPFTYTEVIQFASALCVSDYKL